MPCAICLNKTSVEHIGLSLDQLPPNSLEVQPAYVFTAYMLAAIAGAFGTDHAWRNPGSIDHELLLTATLEGYKPKGSRLNAVAANGKQAMVLVYGGFDTGKGKIGRAHV